MTDSRFICTASSPTSIASSASFLAIFCTPSRNSLDVRDNAGSRSRAAITEENRRSSESLIRERYSLQFVNHWKTPKSSAGSAASGRQAVEQASPVGSPDQGIDQVLGMRHQSENVEV